MAAKAWAWAFVVFTFDIHFMHNIFIQYVYLIVITLALVMIANKLRLAYPIVLVLGGLALSFTALLWKTRPCGSTS
jgi:hypothetical protein